MPRTPQSWGYWGSGTRLTRDSRLEAGPPRGLPHLKGLPGGATQTLQLRRREQVHDPGDDAGPTGLVAGPKTGPVVPVEVPVQQYAGWPGRVPLDPPRA